MHEGSLVLTPEDSALLVDVLESRPLGSNGVRDRYSELLYSLKESAKLVPAPLNGDKLWNGRISWSRDIIDDGTAHNQTHTVVRARSKAEALRMLAAVDGRGETVSRFNTHWSNTAGVKASAIVTERGVWVEGKGGWVKLYPPSSEASKVK